MQFWNKLAPSFIVAMSISLIVACGSEIDITLPASTPGMKGDTGPKGDTGTPGQPGQPGTDADSDGDGVPDKTDKCVLLAGPMINAGCPFVVADTDKDGIPDVSDNCPNVANPAQTDTDKDGQGDACDNDIDGDGVPNAADKCANTPPMTAVDIDGCGCPSGSTLEGGVCTAQYGVKIGMTPGDARLGHDDVGSHPTESDESYTVRTIVAFPRGKSSWCHRTPWGTYEACTDRCWDRNNASATVWMTVTNTGIPARPRAWTTVCTMDGAAPDGATRQAVMGSIAQTMANQGSPENYILAAQAQPLQFWAQPATE